MDFFDLETLKDYTINIIAALSLYALGFASNWLWGKIKRRKFWGKNVSENPSIVLDVFNYNNSIQQNRALRYLKNFHNRQPIFLAGVDKVMGVETARSARF